MGYEGFQGSGVVRGGIDFRRLLGSQFKGVLVGGVGRSDAPISIFADMALSSTELPILTLFYLTLSHF